MKTITAQLQTHIDRTVTTLCTCWKIVRLDGQEFFFTNLDIDIEFPTGSGNVYKASSGMSKSNLVADSNFGVNNSDIQGVFDDIDLKTVDLQNGLFNYATVFQFMVNYEDLTQGEIKLSKSTFGEVTLNDVGVFIVEQRGMTQVLKQQNIVEVYNAECPADLGDTRCGINLMPTPVARNTAYIVGDLVRATTVLVNVVLEDYNSRDYICTVAGTTANIQPVYDTIIGNTTIDGTATFKAQEALFQPATVLSVTNNRKFKVAELTPATTFVESWFNSGAVIWQTGLNTGKAIEVKVYTKDDGITIEQEIELFLATSFNIQVGDKLGIYPGCNKLLQTCIDKYSNSANFRGFPHIPGPSFIPSQIPEAKS